MRNINTINFVGLDKIKSEAHNRKKIHFYGLIVGVIFFGVILVLWNLK